MVIGEAASPGVARGTAVVCRCGCGNDSLVARRTIAPGETSKEIDRFDAAVAAAENALLELQKQAGQNQEKQESAIFDVHIALLRDPTLRQKVSTLCSADKLNVEAALADAVDMLADTFSRMESLYFRERAADLRDVGNRLQEELVEGRQLSIPHFPDGTVLVSNELLPSAIMQLDARAIRGVVVEQGGQTAHSTILARSRGIPLLIHVPDATNIIRTGDQLILDGLSGRVFINPEPEVQREYDRLEADLQAYKTALKGLIDLPSVTRDGVSTKLCANIGKVADASSAASVNADGVGLYRTEFVFLSQDHFPPEKEQYQLYRTTADRLQPREVVIRVLDIGSDKMLPYFPLASEANPSLGCRGTRLLLAHPEILQAQLRAILRLSATHPVALLFPMIGGLEDLRAAKEAIALAKTSLTAEGQPFNPDIRIGAMIETPAAVILAAQLAAEADFLSIGTNDLTQYLLATDRTSSEVAAYYEPLHPAVLQALAWVAKMAEEQNTPVSICGEMAGNPALTELLLGMGFRSLSVNPGELLEIKNAIRSIHIKEAQAFAKRILALGTIKEIKDAIGEAQIRDIAQ
jgi:phosphoenolpyruvate-protein phosphotransferase